MSRVLNSDLIINELEFITSRSSGPGGQNVNKVNSKVTLRWNLKDSALLSPEEKELLLQKLSPRLTGNGSLLISAQEKRSQLQNKEEVVSKLEALLKQALSKKKKRKPSMPSKSSIRSRLDKKKKHADKKRWRNNLE